MREGFSEAAHQVVLEGDALMRGIEAPAGIAGPAVARPDADLGRGRKGVTLHMVDGQLEGAEVVAPA